MGQSHMENGLLRDLPGGAMGQQVVEIINELVELAMKTCCENFGFMTSMVNRRKSPAPSVMQTHEPKNECRALGGTALVNLNDAIELAGGSSMRTPTWRASCRCFTACPPRGMPEVVSFR
jgi:hypothetical protein